MRVGEGNPIATSLECDNGCVFAAESVAVFVSAAALAHLVTYFFSQSVTYFFSQEDCKAVLSNYKPENENVFDLVIDEKLSNCFAIQQEAVGKGSSKECKDALANYLPRGSVISQIGDELGVEQLCNLPSLEWQDHVNDIVEEDLTSSAIRGLMPGLTSSCPKHLFIELKVLTTGWMTCPNQEPYLIAKGTQVETYFQKWTNPVDPWVRADANHGTDIGLREIKDLGRILRGDTVSNTEHIMSDRCQIEIHRKLV